MNSAQLLGCSLIALFFANACSKDKQPDCFTSIGKMTVEKRNIESFNALTVDDRIAIELIQDTIDMVYVSTGTNILRGIKTEVNNGVLSITDEMTCDWVRDQSVIPTVTIHYKQLSHILDQSAAPFIFKNQNTSSYLEFEIKDIASEVNIAFSGDSLSVISHTGATQVSVSGRANVAYFYSNSYGPMNAKELQAKVCYAHNKSTGNIELTAAEALYYQIFDWGNIIVHGNPPNITEWHDKGLGALLTIQD